MSTQQIVVALHELYCVLTRLLQELDSVASDPSGLELGQVVCATLSGGVENLIKAKRRRGKVN